MDNSGELSSDVHGVLSRMVTHYPCRSTQRCACKVGDVFWSFCVAAIDGVGSCKPGAFENVRILHNMTLEVVTEHQVEKCGHQAPLLCSGGILSVLAHQTVKRPLPQGFESGNEASCWTPKRSLETPRFAKKNKPYGTGPMGSNTFST